MVSKSVTLLQYYAIYHAPVCRLLHNRMQIGDFDCLARQFTMSNVAMQQDVK